ELSRAHVEHKAEARGHASVKPDVRNRHCQLDMPHSLASYPRQGHFHCTAVTNVALVFDPLVFPAGTLPITRRPKNSLAEKSALLRLKCPVIDRLRIFNFALAPRAHGIARGHANRDLIKTNCPLFAH